MQRVTVTIDDALLAALDAHAARRGYENRSEAIRDALRTALGMEEAPAADDADANRQPCIATLSYVYDHEKRELARRLTQVQHGHHDLTVASLHVHLDHGTCLEVSVLRGPADEVKQLADTVVTQRGVRYGNLHLVPAGEETHGHEHGHGHPHDHVHSR
ncbi:nickel-responsive transcriptional regulator NikR [Ancylobacter sp. Lp-2]|uniref:nickel-responsive transcriptional regulator NikR n=1 Tax=Ancylobacter sp. Lp-2 TaxID=2881339 RepID=UPI001E3BD123|nr:nickel-responsive transcriptional regulator NikR [Ancylobacter sp. Lp-2]MCB4769205.1 nickel-responsive transcriptional regulator NikR [Ancylobacter sp. Lp-2]